MSNLERFLLGIALGACTVFCIFVLFGLSGHRVIVSLQSQIDSLRQKSDKSVLFLAQEELARNGLSLVVVDSTGKASLLRIKEGK